MAQVSGILFHTNQTILQYHTRKFPAAQPRILPAGFLFQSTCFWIISYCLSDHSVFLAHFFSFSAISIALSPENLYNYGIVDW